eukprot:915310_1
MYWSCIIIESIIKITVLTDIMIPFSDDHQCSIGGKIKLSLWLSRSIILILFFFQVYNIYGTTIQSHKSSLVIQLWLLCLIVIKIIAVFSVNLRAIFSFQAVSDNRDYSVVTGIIPIQVQTM